jgi:hypothetical protein
MNHLDHLKVEDRLIEKGQLAMRQLIADRAKAATDKMRECQNKEGGLFEPEIIPMNPAVRTRGFCLPLHFTRILLTV